MSRISDITDPTARLRRRLVGNVIRTEQGVDYWRQQLARCEKLAAEGNAHAASSVSSLARSVDRRQREHDQACEELALFNTLAPEVAAK